MGGGNEKKYLLGKENIAVERLVAVRFRWERSFDRSYRLINVGPDGNPF
jgi:hypothetical protein